MSAQFNLETAKTEHVEKKKIAFSISEAGCYYKEPVFYCLSTNPPNQNILFVPVFSSHSCSHHPPFAVGLKVNYCFILSTDSEPADEIKEQKQS